MTNPATVILLVTVPNATAAVITLYILNRKNGRK